MLSIVGLGYNVSGHTTPEIRHRIVRADRLFYLVSDPATGSWLRSLRPDAVSLHDCYRPGESGVGASNAMVDRILEPLADGLHVCAAFYGHPAIGMHTTHEAARRARARGTAVHMVPGISFEDCLIADLGIDPGPTGRMMYEATDFVLRPRVLDPAAALVLLQVGAVGETAYREGDGPSRPGLERLRDALLRTYPGDHVATLYEISQLPLVDAVAAPVALRDLAEAPAHVHSTLYVPPLEAPRRDPETVERLGLEGFYGGASGADP